MNENEGRIILYDVDGTITQEGEYSSKALSIPPLETLAESALDLFVNSGILPKEVAEQTKVDWQKAREGFIVNPDYFKRFFLNAEDAENSGKIDHDLVVFEAMKDIAPKYAKSILSLMISGIVNGSLPIMPYEDAVASIKDFADLGYRIATFSGGSVALQEIMLSRVPVDGYSDVAEIVNSPTIGAGFHDKKEFGNKLKAETYQKAKDYFANKGLQLCMWITDSFEEARQGSGIIEKNVFVDRKERAQEELQKMTRIDSTIYPVKDIRKVVQQYLMR